MFNYRTIAIIKRELHERLISKGFILMTILLPVLMFGMIGVQTMLAMYDAEVKNNLKVVTEDSTLTASFKKEFLSNTEQDTLNTFTFATISGSEFEEYLNSIKSKLLSEEITGVVFISNDALENKKIEYYSKIPKNFKLLDKLHGPVNKVLVENYFREKNIADEELEYARMFVDVSRFKVAEGEEAKEEGFGNIILSMVFSFLLYISLLMMGSMVMQSVIQEKTNRIVEVLLSSVTSRELLAGKIIGATVTGVLQMTIWLTPLVLIISTSWFVLPADLILDISIGQILFLLFNFLLGLITFIGLFAMVGSIFENAQDAQSGMWPVMILIIVPFFIAISLMQNPTNPIGSIASMLPFAAIIVMPARMTLVEIPIWQFILSVVVNIATIFAIIPVAGKIYRVGLMASGKKPTWGEVISWLKIKD